MAAPKPNLSSSIWLIVAGLVVISALGLFGGSGNVGGTDAIPYSQFQQYLDANKVKQVTVSGNVIRGTLTDPMPDGQEQLHHRAGAARPRRPARQAQRRVHRQRDRGRRARHAAVLDPAAAAVRRHLDVRLADDDGRARRRLRRRAAVGRALEGQAGGGDRREGHVRRRGRGGRGEGRTARDRRFPEAAGGVHPARRAHPARHPAGGAAGHRQDAAGARGGGRGGGAVLLDQRRRVRRDVRGRRRGAGARPVRAGAEDGAMHHLHRRTGCAGTGARRQPDGAGRTRRSRRSTSCWRRWTGSTARWRS